MSDLPESVLRRFNEYALGVEERNPDEYILPDNIKQVIQVVTIPLLDIDPSTENNDMRSMYDTDLRILADSIKEFGLKEPLRVYKNDNGAFKYTIISGHRRFAAFRILVKDDKYSPNIQIPCIIVNKPLDEISEKIDIAQSNISRKNPKDLVREVNIANDIWQKIINAKRQGEFVPKLKESFKKQNEKNEKYIADPKKFERYHYRSRMEFIRCITGLSVTNKTVQNAINKTMIANTDDEEGQLESDPDEEKEKKSERKVSTSQINRKITSLVNDLSKYCEQKDDVPVEVESFISTLESFRDSYFQVKERKKGNKARITDQNVDDELF